MPDQPLGPPVNFPPALSPAPRTLTGAAVTLRPVDPARDAPQLFAVSHEPDGDPSIWTYLYEGPFTRPEALQTDLEAKAASEDRQFFTIVVDDVAQGIASYLEIVPAHGTIEIGNIWFSPALQRTRAGTEAIYLLAAHAFDDLGYRRLEWKCNALNQPSRTAAERFGFIYEGTFAQHRVVKGRSRDTAWFAITDARWPAIQRAFLSWLAPDNFDADGRQLTALAARAAR